MGPEKSGLDCLFVLFPPSGAPFPDGIVEIDDVCLEPVTVFNVKEEWFFHELFEGEFAQLRGVVLGPIDCSIKQSRVE